MKTGFSILRPMVLILLISACQAPRKNPKPVAENTSPPRSIAQGELEGQYPFEDTKNGYEKAADRWESPLQDTRENVARGKALFEKYCKHCHGISGQSDAPMVIKEKYPPPPKFSERLPELKEGQMFHSIYYGKNLMPGNQNDLTHEEIWLLIAYIQTLK